MNPKSFVHEILTFTFPKKLFRKPKNDIIKSMSKVDSWVEELLRQKTSDGLTLAQFSEGILCPPPFGKGGFLLLRSNGDVKVSLSKGFLDQFGLSTYSNDRLFSEIRLYQKTLHLKDPGAKSMWLENLKLLLQDAPKIFHNNGILNREYQVILEEAAFEPTLRFSYAYTSLEDIYRHGDMDTYYRRLRELTKDLSGMQKNMLKDPDALFFSPFEKDISNAFDLYLTQNLTDAYLNLLKNKARSKKQTKLLILLSIRIGDYLGFSKLMEEESRDFGLDEVWSVFDFQARLRNEQMADLLDRMHSKRKILNLERDFHDSMLLSPLHYALILRDLESVRGMLDGYDWTKWSYPVMLPEDCQDAMSYFFIAVNFIDDPEIARDIFLGGSRKAQSLRRSIHSMGFHKDVTNMSSNKLMEALKIAREEGDIQEIASIRRKIEINAERLEEYEKEEGELRRGLEQLFLHQYEEMQMLYKALKESENPFVQTLLQLYRDPDLLYEFLAGTVTERRLYRMGNLFFIAPVSLELDYSYMVFRGDQILEMHIKNGRDEIYQMDDVERSLVDHDKRAKEDRERREREKREKERKEKQKKWYQEDDYFSTNTDIFYDRLWFSKEAYQDEEELKREYRALVKQYHPDVMGDENSTEILKQIIEERENILHMMNE